MLSLSFLFYLEITFNCVKSHTTPFPLESRTPTGPKSYLSCLCFYSKVPTNNVKKIHLFRF